MDDRMRDELRQSAAKVVRFENVFENAAKIDPRDLVRKYRHRTVAEIERANIVQSKHVVDVAMGDQDGIELAYVRPKSLLPKIARGVDQDSFSGMLDQDRYPQTLVARIIR